MSTESARLAAELDRIYRGPSWHGPALLEVLAGVDDATAAPHPLQKAHSIWEIVLHVTAWKIAALRKLQDEDFKVTPEQDWPAIPRFTEGNWQQALSALESAHTALLGAVRALDDARLEETVPGEDYCVRFMLQGSVEHDAYHAGQIAMLRKAK